MTAANQIDFEKLFNILPERYVVFNVESPVFTMTAASDSYLKTTGRTRDEVIGKSLFDVFPDTSSEALKGKKGPLSLSLDRCIATKKADETGVIRYDIRDANGEFGVRYWRATHYPLINSSGDVYAIAQSAYDITDLVTANDKLKLAELQMDGALSAGLIGSWVWDVPRDIVIGDKGIAGIFDIPVKAAQVGVPLQTFMNSIHSDDQQRVQDDIDAVLLNGGTYQSEFRTHNSSGIDKWVIARGRVERNADDTPIQFVGIIIDISDRRFAEERLKDSETQLRFMADAMPQLVWTANAKGETDYYNEKWYDYTGMSRQSVLDSGWGNILHPDDQITTGKAWTQSLKTGEDYSIEYRLKNIKTGKYEWFVGRALSFKDGSGTTLKWYGTSTNIDEQKRIIDTQTFLSNASKELTSSLDYVANLKKITGLGIPYIADWCLIDLYDPTTGWNAVSVAHQNPSKVEMVQQYRDKHPLDIADLGGVGKVVRTGKFEYHEKIIHNNKRQMVDVAYSFMAFLSPSSVIIAPIAFRGKTVGAITFVFADSGRSYTKDDLKVALELAGRISLSITNAKLYSESIAEIKQRQKLEKKLVLATQQLEERVSRRTHQLEKTNEGLREEIIRRTQAETELQAYSKSLNQSNQELQDFAYVASHDLQEPLRKIQAFGDLLESEYGTELGGGVDYLSRMQNAASRMSILIQDLLSFSRVTTRAKPAEVVNLQVIMSEVLNDLESRIADSHGKIVIVKALPKVLADPTHMRQLFQNLIVNALKFHKVGDKPLVTIDSQLSPDKRSYTMTVKDNGIGFDEKYLDRIFSVFQRLHGKDEYEGTGIGLAVCRKIVERYDGTITAESKENQGSKFVVTLPAINQGDEL